MSPANEPDKIKEPETVEAPEVEVQPTPPITVEDIASIEEHRERRWLMLIVYFLMALAVAILVVFGGRWLYRTVAHKNKPATTTQQTSNPPAGGTPQQPTASPSTPTTPTPTPQQGTPAPRPTTQASQLPNNGPGDVLAIFVGTALAVGGLHYILTLRRSS